MAGAPPGGETFRLTSSTLRCAGCGATVPVELPFAAACPGAVVGDDIDHVLSRRIEPQFMDAHPGAHPNPFVRYRTRLHSYQVAMAMGWSDQRYVELVEELDAAIATVEGRGFVETPIARSVSLDQQLGFEAAGGVWVKDETGNVSGSHKARHLMGIMLGLRVAESLELADPSAPLAIASCGNAALAAAAVARAAQRRLLVFVPPSAEEPVVARLRELGADLEVCERPPGRSGDPTYLRLIEAIDAGAVPFTVQGNLNGHAIEGGATLGWELIDQLSDRGVALDRFVIHVGGGAFASAQALAIDEALALGLLDRRPRFDTVQTLGGYPLARAYQRVVEQLGVDAGTRVEPAACAELLREAARHRSDYMWAWPTEPVSIAHGILDDETYDWLAVVRAMLLSGGRSVVVDEATLKEANTFAFPELGIDADHTGTAGLAGLIQLTRDGVISDDETVAVIFSGARRSSAARDARVEGGMTP